MVSRSRRTFRGDENNYALSSHPPSLYHVRETLLAWIHMAGQGVLGSGSSRGGVGVTVVARSNARPGARGSFVAGGRSSQRGN